MRNKLAWLFSAFILFLSLMTIDTNASAATKSNAQNYVLKNSLFQAITYEATDFKLCGTKKGILYYGKSQSSGLNGWQCTTNNQLYNQIYAYGSSKKKLIFYKRESDTIIFDYKFPLKEGILKETYYDEWNEKTVSYKTKIKFKKTLKTKAGVLKDVIEFDSTINNTAKVKGYNKFYIAKNRGLVKIVNHKGDTTFEVTNFIKK